MFFRKERETEDDSNSSSPKHPHVMMSSSGLPLNKRRKLAINSNEEDDDDDDNDHHADDADDDALGDERGSADADKGEQLGNNDTDSSSAKPMSSSSSSLGGALHHHKTAVWSARQNLGVRGGAVATAATATSPRWRTHQIAQDYISLASSILLPPIHLGSFGYDTIMGRYPIEQTTAVGYLTSPLRRPTVIEKWNPYEIALFEGALALHGKNFHKIHAQYVTTKSTKDIIEFYYIWKKTSHGRRWKVSFAEQEGGEDGHGGNGGSSSDSSSSDDSDSGTTTTTSNGCENNKEDGSNEKKIDGVVGTKKEGGLKDGKSASGRIIGIESVGDGGN